MNVYYVIHLHKSAYVYSKSVYVCVLCKIQFKMDSESVYCAIYKICVCVLRKTATQICICVFKICVCECVCVLRANMSMYVYVCYM